MTEHPIKPPTRAFISDGPWSTLFWSLMIGLAFIAIQTGIASMYFRVWGDGSQAVHLEAVQQNGILISVMTISTAIVCGGLIFLLVRKSKIPVRDYLALKPVSLTQLALWLMALLGFSLLSNLAAESLQQDVVTDFARDLYQNAGNLVLLTLAIVFIGPLFEELFFRGFIYHGLANSKLRIAGAIVITALVWTLIHGQYDWYVRGNIFIIGILFGLARYKSGSILPPLAMHMLMNAMALIEVASL